MVRLSVPEIHNKSAPAGLISRGAAGCKCPYTSRDIVGLKITQHLLFGIRLKSLFQSKVSHCGCVCTALPKAREDFRQSHHLAMLPPCSGSQEVLWTQAVSSPSWLCVFLHSVSGLRPLARSWVQTSTRSLWQGRARHQPAWQTAGTSNAAEVTSVRRDWAVRSLEITI